MIKNYFTTTKNSEFAINPYKSICFLLVFVFSLFSNVANAQDTLFQFNFENNTNPSIDNVVGTPAFSSNGLGPVGYITSNPCQGSRLLTADDWDTGNYYRFTVNTSGFSNMNFSFCNRTDNTQIGTFIVRVSSDNGANWNTVLTSYTPTTSNNTLTTSTFPTTANNSSDVWIEIYKTNNANSNNRDYLIDNVTLTGYLMPTITSFTPSAGCSNTTPVVITGTNFTGVTGVAFGGTNAASYVVNSSTQITAIPAAGSTGVIAVTATGGTATSGSSFTVNSTPTVTSSASPTSITSGGTTTLTASATPATQNTVLLSEGFNAGTNSWALTNNSTGGTPANAAWTLRPDGYSYFWGNPYPTYTFSSNDSSQFYLSNSADQNNSGSTTATLLRSPSMNTTGYTSLSLEFYQFYLDFDGTDGGIVEVSTNNTSWTQVAKYTTTQGSQSSFLKTTVDLSAYINNPTLYVRFRYDANYDWFWAIDNVTVSGNKTINYTYSWAASPSGTAGLPAGAGTASTSNNSIVASPTANTAYTVTATNPNGGCTGTSIVNVSVCPTTAGALSGNQYICRYGTMTTTLSSTISGGTWSSSNTAIATVNATTGLVTSTKPDDGVSRTVTITYSVGGTGGCPVFTATRDVYIANGPGAGPASLSGSNSQCQGSTATYTITPDPYSYSYVWDYVDGGSGATITPAADGLSATVVFGATATSGNIRVQSINACGNGGGGKYIYVTVGAVPKAGTISGTTTVCVGASQPNVIFSNPQNFGVRINYNINGGATQNIYVNANTSSNLGVSTGTAGTFTYNLVSIENGVGSPSCFSPISGSATITVSNPSVVPTGVTGTNTICSGASTTLTLTGGTAAGGTATWYSGSCGVGTPVGTGNSITVSPTSTTIYYVRYEGGCNTTTCASRTVTVNTLSVAPTGIAGTTTICNGSSTTLTLSGGTAGTGATAQWYSGSCGGTLVGTGNSITVSPTSNTTYYVRYSGTCNTTTCASTTVTVNTLSVAPTGIAGTTTICNGSSTTLTLSGGTAGTGATAQWYSGSCGGTLVGTGNSITVSPTSNTTYYVRYSGTCNTTTCASTTVTVNTLSVAPTGIAGTTTICNGSSTTLTLTGGTAGTGATAQWYSGSCGGTLVGTGNSITVSPTSNTTYYVRYSGTCNTTTCASTTVTVNTLSVAPTGIAGTTTICNGSSTTLTLSGGTAGTGATAQWYSGSCGGTLVGTGNSITVSPTSNTTYYVRYSGTCNTTTCASTTVTVNTLSVAPTGIAGTTTICNGSSTTLTLSGGTAGTGATAQWYSGSCGGTLVGTGNSITVSPTSNTTYYVRYSGTCNTTGCASQLVTVNPIQSITLTASNASVCQNTITTTLAYSATVGSPTQWHIDFEAAANTAGITDQSNNLSGTSGTITISVPGSVAAGVYQGNLTVTGTSCPSVAYPITLTVTAAPSSPIVSDKSDVSCSSLGSVKLSGLPASGTIVQTKNGTTDNYTIIAGGTQTITELGSGNYTFAVSNGSCVSASVNVIIDGPVTNTYSASGWSTGALPTIDQKVIFNVDYSSSSDLDACSCKVAGIASVVINSNHTLKVQNEVEVTPNAKLTFENNASLVQINDNAVNKGNINYHRHTTPVKRYDFTYWSSPVVGQTLKKLSPNTLYDKYYSYNSGWVISYSGVATMVPGNGYIIRAPQPFSITVASVDTNPTFIGEPNNGLVSFSLAGNKTHLLGNPYPSAMDADVFLDVNSAVLQGTLYFWTHNSPPSTAVSGTAKYNYTTNDYATYNRTGGVGTGAAAKVDSDVNDPNNNNNLSVPTGKIAAGQGFFAPASAAGGTVVFNNRMRVVGGTNGVNNKQFFKLATTSKTSTTNVGSIEKNRVWLNLTNNEGAFKQTLVGYITGATNDYDGAFDGVTYDGNQFVDFYSVNNSVNLSIQGRALPFVKKDSVALGYKSTIKGDFQISIDHTDGVLTTQNVFLEDKDLKVLHDLKKEAYTFSTEKGIFNDRFVLRYVDKNVVEPVIEEPVIEVPVVDVPVVDKTVLVSVNKNQISVSSTEDLISKITVYDILGKVLYRKEAVAASDFIIPYLISSQQVLLVNVVLVNGKTTSTKIIY